MEKKDDIQVIIDKDVPGRAWADWILQTMNDNAPWIYHSQTTAAVAEKIVSRINGLNGEVAYALGLLHDVGKRSYPGGLAHLIGGYKFMIEQGFGWSARVCITHGLPMKRICAFVVGAQAYEIEFVQTFLRDTEYTRYDQLIQLADMLVDDQGRICRLEQRRQTLEIRHGASETFASQCARVQEIKEEFEKLIGVNDLFALLNSI